VIIGFTAYLSFFATLGLQRDESVQINSQSQMESLLKIEKEKLGCDRNIEVKLLDPLDFFFGGRAQAVNDDKYRITIKRGSSLTTLRHELYHVCSGHLKSSSNPLTFPFYFLKYLFWEEPAAEIYSLTGLKL
jgi:hypothetical protein